MLIINLKTVQGYYKFYIDAINLFCLISQSSSKPPDATDKENACENRENIKTRRIDLAAKQLSKLVLAPVKDKLGKKRLVVVADGALQYIPFAALADLNAQTVSSSNSVNPQIAGDSKSNGIKKSNSQKAQPAGDSKSNGIKKSDNRKAQPAGDSKSPSNSESPLKRTENLLYNASNHLSSVRFNGLGLLQAGLQPQVGGMFTRNSQPLLDGMLTQNSQSQTGGMLAQNSQSQTDGMFNQNSQPLLDGMLTQNSQSQTSEISTKHSKQNQKDSSCNNTGGISVCENENSPQNKINYQPLLINHE